MLLIISSKKVYATKRLVAQAKRLGLPIQVMEVGELAKKKFKVDISKYKTLYVRQPYLKTSPKYLPQIVELAKKFKASGKRVVDNVIAAGQLGLGKWSDYKKLQKYGISIPKTLPLIHPESKPILQYPIVLKWMYGFKGKGVFLAKNKNELKNLAKKFNKKELLLQEFILAKYEYKVITVGYKCLPVILRFAINPKTFRPDFKHYKIIKKSKLSKIVKLSEKASKILGRELSKIDILEVRGKFYVLEVNRFPGLASFERLTKFNVAVEFVKYLK